MSDYFKHQAHPRQLSIEELEGLIEKQRDLELKTCEIATENSPTGGDNLVHQRKHKLEFLKEIHRNLLLCKLFI